MPASAGVCAGGNATVDSRPRSRDFGRDLTLGPAHRLAMARGALVSTMVRAGVRRGSRALGRDYKAMAGLGPKATPPDLRPGLDSRKPGRPYCVNGSARAQSRRRARARR